MHVLGGIFATCSFRIIDEAAHFRHVFSETLNHEATFSRLNVSVADEGDTNDDFVTSLALTTIFLNLTDDFGQRVFCSLDPRGHGTRAVHDEAKLEELLT